MPDLKEKIEEIIRKYGDHEKDFGGTMVQIAILTEKILNLSEHLKKHKHDNTSKRGLLLKLSQRKKLLNYLRVKSPEKYKKITQELKL